jgi:hypothetical protein
VLPRGSTRCTSSGSITCSPSAFDKQQYCQRISDGQTLARFPQGCNRGQRDCGRPLTFSSAVSLPKWYKALNLRPDDRHNSRPKKKCELLADAREAVDFDTALMLSIKRLFAMKVIQSKQDTGTGLRSCAGISTTCTQRVSFAQPHPDRVSGEYHGVASVNVIAMINETHLH